MNGKTRLNKYISSCSSVSRRAADELIKTGNVSVNDKPVKELGVSVSEKDVVKVKGKIINPLKKEYVLFNKPPGYITSRKDEKGRKTIYDILPERLKGLKPAGRLDKDSGGLLILTNDGDLIQELTHPKGLVPRVYRVVAEGRVKEQDLLKFRDGIEIEKGKIAYAETIILDYSENRTTLEMTLFQGYNRQIRRMLEKVKHPVIALKRVSHGCLELGGLDRGKFRFMKPKEVQGLRNYLRKIAKNNR